MYEGHGLYIDGAWRKSASGATYVAINPATEEPIGEAPVAGREDALLAIAAAERGLEAWRRTPAWDRARVLRKVAILLTERMEEIARILTIEVGKPLAQSRREVQLSIDQFEWFAEETKRIFGQSLESRVKDGRMLVDYEPVGIVAAFTAWNFPLLLLSRKIAPALCAGCSIVARPAEEAPGTAMALFTCCHDAGIPAGAVNLLTGPPHEISATLMAAPQVRKVSLTGSIPVGRQIMAAAAQTMKRLSMELGGHAPVIVCADADAEQVAELAVPVKFANAGQVCVSPSRFYVHESRADAFAKRFAETAKGLRIGNGLDPETQLGPLATRRRRDQTEAIVERTRAEGAELLCGGKRPAGFNRGFFYEPTAFKGVTDSAQVMNEEPFAPIAPIATFREFDDAVKRANSLEYGLAAYVFTKSMRLANEARERIETGMIGINTFFLAAAEAPFGGIKQSGFGREGGTIGIRDYQNVKYVHALPA